MNFSFLFCVASERNTKRWKCYEQDRERVNRKRSSILYTRFLSFSRHLFARRSSSTVLWRVVCAMMTHRCSATRTIFSLLYMSFHSVSIARPIFFLVKAHAQKSLILTHTRAHAQEYQKLDRRTLRQFTVEKYRVRIKRKIWQEKTLEFCVIRNRQLRQMSVGFCTKKIYRQPFWPNAKWMKLFQRFFRLSFCCVYDGYFFAVRAHTQSMMVVAVVVGVAHCYGRTMRKERATE